MRDPPDISILLALAAEAADAERPLVERCRAIAERERCSGMAAYDAVRAVLAERYGMQNDVALLRRLAADIRAGRFDTPGPERAQVARLLLDFATQRLRENNPRF